MFVPQNRNVLIFVYAFDYAVAAKHGQQIKCVYSMLNGKFEVNVLGAISYCLGVEIENRCFQL